MESPDKKIEPIKPDIKEKRRNEKRYENEGLVRVEIDLDLKTYVYLLKLVEKSGYEIDTDVNKKQWPNRKSGITGVITQGIVELYSKYIKDKNQYLGLDKRQQQSYIFENRIYGMTRRGAFDDNNSKITNDQILALLKKSKMPDYIEVDENLEVSFNKSEQEPGQKFPDFYKPKRSEPMKKDLEKHKLDRFISLSEANPPPEDE
ncbi:MAG: hypothetical protein ACR65R_19235 [Methylomicrobium sp.]